MQCCRLCRFLSFYYWFRNGTLHRFALLGSSPKHHTWRRFFTESPKTSLLFLSFFIALKTVSLHKIHQNTILNGSKGKKGLKRFYLCLWIFTFSKWFSKRRSLTECNLVLTQSVSNSFDSITHFRSNSSVVNVAQKFSEFHVYILNRFLPYLIRNFSRKVSTKLKPVSWAFVYNF